MKVKILGTQSPFSILGHNCPGFLIIDDEHKLMLDCGSGCHKFLNYPDDLKNLTAILTHLHRDHYVDIFILQYASFCFHNQKRLKNPINILLPSTPKERYVDIVTEKDSYASYTTINKDTSVKVGNMTVTFLPTHHPIETYCTKVTANNKTIVYTSDTSFSAKDEIVKFAKNVDLLICESSLLKAYGFPEINSHLTAYQAGVIAKEAKVKCLMLTHFWPEELIQSYVAEAKKIFQNVIPAIENQEIDLDTI